MTDLSGIENTPALVLASQSPRRAQLLEAAGLVFTVAAPAPEVEELAPKDLPAGQLVQSLAKRKAAHVAQQLDSGLVLGCDTVASCGGQILGKPHDSEDARRMLKLLRGRQHEVLTGLCLWHRPSDWCHVLVETTRLEMSLLSDDAIQAYLESGQWQGKAGAFGYQDRPDWLQIIEGSQSNVVGLPIHRLIDLLEQQSWEKSSDAL